jgi:hypothetical protein
MTEKPKRRGCETPRKRDAGEPNVRYSQGLTARICARLAQGAMWHRLCKEPGMPAYSTFYTWQKQYPAFAEAVAAAQAAAADYCADRALEVAEEATKETATQDRLLVNTLLKRADRVGGRKTRAADKPEPVEIVFRVRHFERVVGPDGKAFVREIKPEGEA